VIKKSGESLDRLRQSLQLLISFRKEQREPDSFYRRLASDTAELVGQFYPLDGATVVDVGGGPGDGAEALHALGARPITVDISWEEMDCRPRARGVAAVIGDGKRLPLVTSSCDVVCCSNVLEHVLNPAELIAELHRVVRPGGVVFINHTLWLSPFGGHETAPWHLLLGGFGAERRYVDRHGTHPKNRYCVTLFRYDVDNCLRDISGLQDAEIVDAFPRYLPRWTRFVVKTPVLRDIATFNLAVVIRKTLGRTSTQGAPVSETVTTSSKPVNAAARATATASARRDLPDASSSIELPVSTRTDVALGPTHS